MSAIARSLAEGMNPNRVACAAHEIGHGVAFHTAGIPIRRMHIRPGPPADGWAGACDPGVDQIPASQVAGWQVGLMAGEAAVYRFARHYCGYSATEAQALAQDGARHDAAEFRGADLSVLTLAQARTRAAALIDRHSGRIDRLTLRLAIACQLPGSAL